MTVGVTQRPTGRHVDTVFVVGQRAAADSVRITSGSVQVTDTVHAVVRQTGGEGLLIGSLVLTAALVGVTLLAHVQMHRLQERNNALQADHAKLQREFNDMQARQEHERRRIDQQRDEEHRRAVDARISAVAYALHHQLQSWLNEVPVTMKAVFALDDSWVKGKEVGQAAEAGIPVALLQITVNYLRERHADEYKDEKWAKEEALRMLKEWLEEVLTWAQKRSGEHFDPAEGRMQQLVAAAPEASTAVAHSIRQAYVLFYEATARLSRQVVKRKEEQYSEASAEDLTLAYGEILACAKALEPAIGVELASAWQNVLERGLAHERGSSTQG